MELVAEKTNVVTTDSSVYSIPSLESRGLSSALKRAIEASERVPNRISLSMLMNSAYPSREYGA